MSEENGSPSKPVDTLMAAYLQVSSPNTVKGYNGPPGPAATSSLAKELQALRRIIAGLGKREELLGEVLRARLKEENKDWISGIETALAKGEMPADEIVQKQIELKGTNGHLVFVGQRRLDTAKIEEEMGSLWVESHKKLVGMFQIKFGKGEGS